MVIVHEQHSPRDSSCTKTSDYTFKFKATKPAKHHYSLFPSSASTDGDTTVTKSKIKTWPVFAAMLHCRKCFSLLIKHNHFTVV